MPRRAVFGEHVDDHQMEFAIELERAGKIVLVREPVELAAAIELVLSKPIQQQDPSSESEMTRLVSATLTRCASGAR
jgi:UDP-N-acetylglucosamine transferase subunit ALG13